MPNALTDETKKVMFQPARNQQHFVNGRRASDGERIWTCTNCGASDVWGSGWHAYCTPKEEHEGLVRAVLCPDCIPEELTA